MNGPSRSRIARTFRGIVSGPNQRHLARVALRRLERRGDA